MAVAHRPGSKGNRLESQKMPGPSSSHGYQVANPERMASLHGIGSRRRYTKYMCTAVKRLSAVSPPA